MRVGKVLDVVEAPRVIGQAMLALGTTPVPHIVVPGSDTVHWLLPHRAADRRPWPWARISRYVKVLPSDKEFGVPGACVTDGLGPHWAYPDGWDGGHIADEWLTEDLAVCTLAHLGPPAQRCELCPKPLWPEGGVRVVRPCISSRDLSRNTIRVHTQCARTQGLM